VTAAEERGKLLALLLEQKTLMDEFLRLTGEQTASIAAADGDALNASLRAREEIIEKFDAARRASDALAESLGVSVAVSDAELASLRDAIRDTARAAAAQNEENAALSRAKLSELGGEMKKLTIQQKSVLSYNNKGVLTGRSELFDTKL
jgi:alkanesulfonate monooxygenase SsuD/methylene tetrahydromethanopterin reductase-like flavin-dependent oxidoreductase (luciferase family)